MLDLFTHAAHYPQVPGYKRGGTSREAAVKIESKAKTLRQRCLNALEEAGPWGMTPDEIAAKLNETVLAVRPRLSELKGRGLAKENGLRRVNVSGLAADVLVAC